MLLFNYILFGSIFILSWTSIYFSFEDSEAHEKEEAPFLNEGWLNYKWLCNYLCMICSSSRVISFFMRT